MNRFFSCIIVVCVAVLMASCVSMTRTRVTGKSISVNMKVRDFSQIEANGSMDVYFTQADSFSVRVVAPQVIIDDMEVAVNHSVLTIKPHERHFLNFGDTDVKIYITAPTLTNVSLAGSGDFHSDAPLQANHFSVSLAGSGDVDVKNLLTNSLKIDIAGSGDVAVNTQKLNYLESSIAGSGDIVVKTIYCEKADLSIAGSGDIAIDGKVNQLNQSVAGSGEIHVGKANKNE